ncbi:MAG TPA: hypothetical protein VEZ71_16275 [Archangium sp.]|nr:hypothetical protein [Archangium sp.]
MSAPNCPLPAEPTTAGVLATLREAAIELESVAVTVQSEALSHLGAKARDAVPLLESRMVALTAERDAARDEALRLYCESWGMAVKVAEVREVLAETSFSADVLRMAQELAAQQRKRAEGAEQERDALRERVQALEKDRREAEAREHDAHSDRDEAQAQIKASLRASEDLADSLDREHRAHAQTRQALVEATREADGLRPVALAAGAVLSICDTTTGMGQTEERLHQLGLALDNLRAALNGTVLVMPIRETIANLIMLASWRCVGQGRDFNAFEAAALVEAWFLGEPGQPKASPSLESDSRYRVWLQQWTDGRVAEREAELRGAAEPFLQLARDRLARRSHEPIPELACRYFLQAFGAELPEVDHG